MSKLIIHPTDISQWYALVNEAQASAQIVLNENVESYLVFLLIRFSHKSCLLESVIALDFLESMQASGRHQLERLRDVGDKSLLFCGLFPGVAIRRRVSLDYFGQMGRAAYLTLSEKQGSHQADLYFDLSTHFLAMQQVLQGLRCD